MPLVFPKMRNMYRQTHFLRRLCLVVLAPALLAACQVEGGVSQSATTAASEVQPVGTSATQAQAVAARKATWTIGLTDQPDLLTPYQASSTEQRRAAPVSELLFPSPVLIDQGSYTTTGVLEQVPTLENGGAEIRKADVYLDASGAITTTATQVITRPIS
jgi:peptide/nickel transport system substrate-binding protein